MIPKSIPKQTEEVTRHILKEQGVTDKIALLGIRGYYKDSMGKPGVNDRGIYDDAIFLVGPECHVAFNANTDPTAQFKTNVATLCPGVYEYQKGLHGISGPSPYPALRQFSNVKVRRDKHTPGNFYVVEDTPKDRFWINIHRGGWTKTSSEGCQTIPPSQWESFISMVYRLFKEQETNKIKYCLIEA